MSLRIGILHGPNLNTLGAREPDVYGSATLAEIDAALDSLADELGVSVESYQSNIEGELVDRVQAWSEADGLLVNAAAYTHTSVALRDALRAAARPYVEVHLSNVHAREDFRRVSLLAEAAAGVVCGFGPSSYLLGLRGLVEILESR